MATSNPDGEGFRPVHKPKNHKKAKTTPSGAPRVKPEVETDVRFIFQLPKNPRREFQPAQQVKLLVTEMMKYDNTIAFHSLIDEDLLYPQYDPFPLKEKPFETYFTVHPIPKRSMHRNSVTIGCHMLSTKSIKELKAAKNDDSNLLTWLKTNRIFVEADTLGRKTIRTIGYLFFLHPQMMHHTSCKGILQEALFDVKLTRDEVIAIDPDALEYYHYTNDPTQDATNDTLEQAMDDYLNDDSKLMHIPFELYRTEVGYGPANARVDTKVIGIKSNVEYGKILNELFLRMKVGNHIFPNLQYVPVGLAANIGQASYMQLIRDNNAYLTALTSIPVKGFNDRILNYTIPVHTDDNREEQRTIREILMATDWCIQIEPTQNPGRILLLTTKSLLEVGREWLDDNLSTIFTQFLPKNPHYQLDSDHIIPTHADIRPANATLDSYANALKKKINLQPTTMNTQPQFAHPPANRTPPLTTLSYSAVAQKHNTPRSTTTALTPKSKKTKCSNPLNTTEHSQDTIQTSTTTTTHINLQNDILTTI